MKTEEEFLAEYDFILGEREGFNYYLSEDERLYYIVLDLLKQYKKLLIEQFMKTDVEKDLELLRAEMKKENPDGDKIFRLLCGDKYNKPIKS